MATLNEEAPVTTTIPTETVNDVETTVPASQTATEYINAQLRLEADAREVLPFSFDRCTQTLGPLRQQLFACLTCNPPSSSPDEPHTPAGVCYSCSIACHGEHTLVELFHRRNFVCDCGTTRLPPTSPCNLRIDPNTGMKGPVHSEDATPANTYNHNFRNRFCGCGEWYDAYKEKGTMFQCLGLKTEDEGGCGEDWWHPECIVWGAEEGKRRRKEAEMKRQAKKEDEPKDSDKAVNDGSGDGPNGTRNDTHDGEAEHEPEETELPPGFPDEDSFDTFICYKCVDGVPSLKQYAGSDGFLPPVFVLKANAEPQAVGGQQDPAKGTGTAIDNGAGESTAAIPNPLSRKRSADEADLDMADAETDQKKVKPDSFVEAATDAASKKAYHTTLPPAPTGQLSVFCTSEFRESLCRCRECYPIFSPYPMLLEEEDNYEPPLSASGDPETAGSIGSKSILDMGEEALSNVDRVRAIEGVMAYNDLKEKVKGFLKPFAESGTPVGAEDIKKYFEGLRGDETGKPGQGESVGGSGSADGEGDNRKEQGGAFSLFAEGPVSASTDSLFTGY